MAFEQHKDRPRAEIMAFADETIKKFQDRGAKAEVHFKYTCPKCGERCTFSEPNLLYEQGDCFNCGETHPVERAGFSVYLKFNE